MTSEDDIIKSLEAKGWRRRFMASEPRLGEAVEMYREMGFQVRLVPLSAQDEPFPGQGQDTDGECRACFDGAEGRHSIIFTKPSEKDDPSCSD